MSAIDKSEYGKYISLQNYSGSVTAPGTMFISGAVGSERIKANSTLSASAMEMSTITADDATVNDSLTVGGASDLNGALDVAGQVDLAATGVTTTVRGTFNVDEAATFDSTMSGSSTLKVGGIATFQTHVLPAADNTSDLGSGAKEFKDLYLDGTAYIDSLQADQLGAALDANSQAITNINVDSGAIDGTVIGANSTANGSFSTLVGATVSSSAALSGHSLDIETSADIDGALDVAQSVTAGTSFIIGSADLNETDLEKLDGITNGTVAASKAVVVDASKDASGFRHVTATGAVTAGTSFIIGSADLNETDMEKLDGITDGTAAANKALVLDASKNIGTINQLTASYAKIDVLDVNEINSITRTETTLEVVDKLLLSASGSASAATDGGGLQMGGTSGSDTVASFLYDHANAALDFNLGGTTEMRLQDGVLRPETDNDVDLGASGAEFKDLYLDGVAYIDDLRADQLGAALDANSQAITNINVDSGAIDGTTLGANSAAAGTFTALIGTTSVSSSAALSGHSLDIEADADIDGDMDVAGSVTAGTSFIIGSADLNETDMEKLDGITDGTGAANKALVLDGSRDVDTINALGIASMANNWTNAGRTVADMGIVTTMDLNGGSVDGTVVGATSAAAGTFTALIGTTSVSSSAALSGQSLDIEADADVDGALDVAGNVTAQDQLKLTANGSNSQFHIEMATSTSKCGIGVNASDQLMLSGASGHVLIKPGTDAAGKRFAVLNQAGNANRFYVDFEDGDGYFAGDLQVAGNDIKDSGGNTNITFDGSKNTTVNGNLAVSADGTGKDFTVFSTASGEKMFFDASDNKLSILQSSSNLLTLGSNSSSDFALDVAEGSNNINKVRASAFVTYSDENLKTNVETFDGALDKVMNLRGVTYDWKSSGTADFGFIAQEVQEVLPECVAGGDIMGVDYARVSAVLVEAIKEQQAQIEDLKAKLSE